jgi:uncharacterized protein YndB with AHSA1/START domain
MAKTSYKISVNAPKSRVFRTLTTKSGLKGWFTPHIEGEVAQGETVVCKFSEEDPLHWRFVDLTSPTIVRWQCVRGPGATAGTEVTFRLSDSNKDGHTVVECDHDGFKDTDNSIKSCNTLWGILMDRLRTFSETEKAQPAFK